MMQGQGVPFATVTRPDPATVGPYRATPIRSRPDGTWYWKVTEGGARGRDVSADVLSARWATRERVVADLREAQERRGTPTRWTVGDLLDAWLNPRQPISERAGESRHTRLGREGSVARWREDALWSVDVDELDRGALEAARRRLLGQYASSTVGLAFAHLRAAWRWTREQGAVSRDLPVVRVEVRPQRAKPIPTEDEVRAILDALSGWHRVAYLLLIETGARAGEIMTLRRECVDLDQGVIRVSGKLTRRIGPDVTREIPLDPDGDALAALRTWCADRLPGRLWPVQRETALKEAIVGVCDRLGMRRLSPNAFRRRADILLLDAGELASLPSIMDHSLAEAQRTYALPESAHLRRAVSALRMGATQPRDTAATQPKRSAG